MTKAVINEHLFRDLVRSMKLYSAGSHPYNRSFSKEIFKCSNLYFLKNRIEKKDIHEVKSEQRETIEALNQFVEKKFEENVENRFLVKGGEVTAKSKDLCKFSYLVESYSGNKTVKYSDPLLKSKFKVIFIGLEPKDINENDMLSKMINATKIPESDYLKIYIDLETSINELIDLLMPMKISYIVSLGARATNLILNSKKKMTEVHGQFLDLSVTQDQQIFTTKIMPLFHPDFLNINDGMKKSAWVDLQKLMLKIE